MPSGDLLLAFAAATLIFAFLPGPALLYTAAQTMARGRAGGLMAALGLAVGGTVHVVASVLGLSAIFTHVPQAYAALKIIGAIYLVWLGVGIIRGRLDTSELPQVQEKSARRSFVDSVTVEVLNPKTALFYIAFLPQFADAAAAWPVWLQLLTLGIIVNLAFSAVDVICVLLVTAVLSALRKSAGSQAVLRWLGGGLLIGLGAHFAFSKD